MSYSYIEGFIKLIQRLIDHLQIEKVLFHTMQFIKLIFYI